MSKCRKIKMSTRKNSDKIFKLFPSNVRIDFFTRDRLTVYLLKEERKKDNEKRSISVT